MGAPSHYAQITEAINRTQSDNQLNSPKISGLGYDRGKESSSYTLRRRTILRLPPSSVFREKLGIKKEFAIRDPPHGSHP